MLPVMSIAQCGVQKYGLSPTAVNVWLNVPVVSSVDLNFVSGVHFAPAFVPDTTSCSIIPLNTHVTDCPTFALQFFGLNSLSTTSICAGQSVIALVLGVGSLSPQ